MNWERPQIMSRRFGFALRPGHTKDILKVFTVALS
jgi:hypothetical protein